MGVPSPPSSPRRAGAAPHSTSSTSIGLVLAGVACLAAVAVGSFGLTTEATLGIDLGTTFSVAATCERGIVTVVRVPGGSGTRDAETMPSVVYFPERAAEAAVVGADAAMRRATHPRRVVYDAKRIIGKRVDDPAVAEETKHLPFAVVDNGDGFAAIEMSTNEHEPKSRHTNHTNTRLIAPEEVGAMILERLKRVAERGDGGAVSVWKSRLGFRFRTVTVSVPVNFSKEQKAATLRAARSAGFTVARLLEEPVAAAVAHGLLEKNEKDARKEKRDENDGGKLVLVYDMGGGTLDVAVLRSEKSSGTFLVMGSAGDERLGGEDFDRALLDRWLLKRLETDPTTRSEPIFFPNDAGLRERALREMERAKRFLVDQSSAVRVSVTFMREPLGKNAVGATTKKRLVVADVKTLLSEDEESDADSYDSDESDEQKSLAKKKTTLTLSLADFESACSALLDKATAPVYAALRNAGGVGVKEITDVVMVGGSSRLKSVQTRLAAVFGEDRVKRGGENGPDPETAVAVGAARSYAC